jgi:hypothetical protein
MEGEEAGLCEQWPKKAKGTTRLEFT